MKLFTHIWWWLSVDTRCAWCRRTFHRAPLAFLRRHNHSDGLCQSCEQKILKF